MWDLIVSVPDHCLSFYFSFLDKGGSRLEKKVRAKYGQNHTSPFNILVSLNLLKNDEVIKMHGARCFLLIFVERLF